MVSPVTCAVVVHLLGAAAAVPAAEVPPALMPQAAAMLGEWVLNHDESDDPREIMRARQEAARPRRPPMGGPGGMGAPGGMGGAGGMGGPGMHGGGAVDAGPMRQIREQVLVAPESLTIREERGDLVFAFAGGRTALVTPDGKKVNDKLEDVEIKAQRKGERLLVERKYYFGASLVEEYSVSPTTRQLIVMIEFEPGRGDAVKFRRVFDRPPEAAAP
jgi:hypothetical protein